MVVFLSGWGKEWNLDCVPAFRRSGVPGCCADNAGRIDKVDAPLHPVTTHPIRIRHATLERDG
jgi:hypothetical protein